MKVNAGSVLAIAAAGQSIIGLMGGKVPDWLKVLSLVAAGAAIVAHSKSVVIREVPPS